MKKWILPLLVGLCALQGSYLGATPSEESIATTTLNQQAKSKIEGTVMDEEGMPLIGVSIQVKGTTIRALTDPKGYFQMQVPDNSPKQLIFSCIGMITKEVTWQGTNPLKVVMEEDQQLLDEVVVTGYQSISKERVTGSFEVINQEEIQSKLSTNILGALAGQVPGLTQLSNNDYFIRGVATLKGQYQPLIVVDGMPFEGDLSAINPALITKVTILKDAAAASIYGARAANGVIVLNTIEGAKDGKLSIAYNGSFQVTPTPRWGHMNRLTTPELIELQKESFGLRQTKYNPQNRYYLDPISEALAQGQDGLKSSAEVEAILQQYATLDNSDQILNFYLQPAFEHQHSLSISGGTQKSRYTAALSYNQSRGFEKYAGDEQIAYRLRNIIDITSWLRADLGIYGMAGSGYKDIGVGSFYNAYLRQPSYQLLYDQECDGLNLPQKKSAYELQRLTSLGLLDESYSPMKNRGLEMRNSQQRYNRIQASLNATLLEGLNLDLKLQLEETNANITTNYDAQSYTVRAMINDAAQYDANKKELTYNVPLGGQMREQVARTFSYTVRPQINYMKEWGDHFVTALLGNEIRAVRTRSNSSYYMGYNGQTLGFIPINPKTLSELSGTEALEGRFSWESSKYNYLQEHEDRFVSLYANASYTYQNKLNLTGSIRMDQSNLFGTDPRNQYRPLWSLGTSYDLTQDHYLRNVEWLNLLKVRLTYGIGGNIPKDAGPYLTISAPAYSSWLDDFASRIVSPPNPFLRWEKTATTNLGLDFALWGERLTGSLDIYNKNSTDLLAYRDADPTIGFGRLLLNYGAMWNRGVELSLNGLLLKKKDFTWQSRLNIAYNKNQLVKITDQNKEVFRFTSGNVNTNGYPMEAIFSPRYAGLSSEDGSPLYFDGQGNKVAEIKRIEDLKYMGSAIPTTNIAFINNWQYKGLSCSLILTYTGGHMMRVEAAPYIGYAPNTNIGRGILNRWKKSGDEQNPNTTPAMVGRPLQYDTDLQQWATSDRYTVPADYISIRQMVLAYTCPTQPLKAWGIDGLTLTLQADNLWNIPFNKFGIDPEKNVMTNSGWGQNTYTTHPTLHFGISLNL